MRNTDTFFKIAVVFLFLFSSSRSVILAQSKWRRCSSLYGMRAKRIYHERNEHSVRVFVDKEGGYYPEYYIKDNSLKRANNSLLEWYRTHEDDFKVICQEYEIPSSLRFDEKVALLNETIERGYLEEINKKLEGYDNVVILIHGFRKKVYGSRKDRYSTKDNIDFQKGLEALEGKSLFVEVYWDSTYAYLLQGIGKRGFKLFEEQAIPNANVVGYQLRSLIAGIKAEELNVFTHSLGARVIANTLFNVSKDQTAPTPSQKNISICLVAPAIGSEIFKNYYNRNTHLDFNKEDNYRLAIQYNKHDFVLLKDIPFTWGASVYSRGNTALGLNYEGDVTKLQQLFLSQFTGSKVPIAIDTSISNDNEPLECHLVRCYTENRMFEKVLDFYNNQ